jgi:two-component system, cell cycle sensor histidine kinase and response regulator CckA
MAEPIRVLLIEDSSDDVALATRALQRGGLDVRAHSVATMENLEIALRTGSWDIILSDHSMPGFDGMRAMELVRHMAPEVPFLLVSGTIGEERAVAAIKAGAYDYVPKGNISRLPDAIGRALRDTAQRRARVSAEEAARRTSDQLRALHDASPVGIVTLEAGATVVTWNRAAERIFGRPAREAIGRALPLDAAGSAVFDRLRQRTLQGDAVSDVELETHRPPSGKVVVVSCSTAPLRDASGDISGLVAVFADVTRRRELEHHFHLTQRLESLGRLAGGIAHDFNNLMTAILGTSQMLIQDLGEDVRAEEAKEIRDAALRAAALTKQLLAFSRRQVLQPEVLDLNVLVRDLEKMLRRLLGEQVQLHTELAEDLGAVRADPGQLEQVIVNLAINARDAMPQGGTLTIETANVHLVEPPPGDEPEVRAGEYVMIGVSDTGVGMDASTRGRVFEPFFTTKERGRGTGLGLATVYGIVKQSGGYIWVTSEPGQGAEFRTFLPRVSSALAARPPERPAAPEQTLAGTETILVVEDEEPVRNLTRRILTAKGYQVLEAASGSDAIELLAARTGAIDLLVSDVIMPGMGGRQLAERLLAQRPGLKVLFVSGYTDDDVIKQGILDPGTPFLPKPFTPETLLRKIRDVLDG